MASAESDGSTTSSSMLTNPNLSSNEAKVSTLISKVSSSPSLSNSLSATSLQLVPTVTKEELLKTDADDDLSLVLAELGLGLVATLTIGKVKYKKDFE
ncbi:Type IV pilus biosis protein PilO [Lactococcus lactis subsp. lactis]|nr:Type IV pilus biosis protein PilO [Lactococcus lactis subsp. lactis]